MSYENLYWQFSPGFFLILPSGFLPEFTLRFFRASPKTFLKVFFSVVPGMPLRVFFLWFIPDFLHGGVFSEFIPELEFLHELLLIYLVFFKKIFQPFLRSFFLPNVLQLSYWEFFFLSFSRNYSHSLFRNPWKCPGTSFWDFLHSCWRSSCDFSRSFLGIPPGVSWNSWRNIGRVLGDI